jgi:hypothetical protein
VHSLSAWCVGFSLSQARLAVGRLGYVGASAALKLRLASVPSFLCWFERRFFFEAASLQQGGRNSLDSCHTATWQVLACVQNVIGQLCPVVLDFQYSFSADDYAEALAAQHARCLPRLCSCFGLSTQIRLAEMLVFQAVMNTAAALLILSSRCPCFEGPQAGFGLILTPGT